MKTRNLSANQVNGDYYAMIFFSKKNYLLIESNLLLEELLVGMLDILSLGLVKGVDLRHHRERQGVGSSAKNKF